MVLFWQVVLVHSLDRAIKFATGKLEGSSEGLRAKSTEKVLGKE